MVEHVKDHTLYHVTVTKPYKTAFQQGQIARVGDDANPFFGFYETPRTYPVKNLQGEIVDVPAIKFLKVIRDKQVTYPNFPAIAAAVAEHYLMLSRELLMEQIRLQEFEGQPPSRQRCLFCCDTIEEARHWNKRLNDNGTVCELTCSGIIHRADARQLLGDSEPLSVTMGRARAYWLGETTDQPEMEILFAGEAVVKAIHEAEHLVP